MPSKILKPGMKAPISGQARRMGHGNLETTVVKGKPIPPIGKGKGQRIRIVDPTNHKQA